MNSTVCMTRRDSVRVFVSKLSESPPSSDDGAGKAVISASLLDELGRHVGPLDPEFAERVSGGDINDSFTVRTQTGQSYFLKCHAPQHEAMFIAEAAGLAALAAAGAVRVPCVVAAGTAADCAYLLMEHLQLRQGTPAAAAALGRDLATQHRVSADQFGWEQDNTIGSTPQLNCARSSWLDFFHDARLSYQLDLAKKNDCAPRLCQLGAQVCEALPDLLLGHQPAPALLHGDLWGGNWGQLPDGEAVIFDPAVYFGDREADLAMTRLFGGFPAEFYAAYEAAWPLPQGHADRVALYNLYHVLNHLNLFGGAYAAQAEGMMERLLG
ncbi:MAG: fructosamine kinase family protein [Gammaproteobacteria bacterium]